MTGPKGWKEGRDARTTTGSFGRFQMRPSHLITNSSTPLPEGFTSVNDRFDGRVDGEHRHQAMVVAGLAANLPHEQAVKATAGVLEMLGFQ